jgi:hypothetical protein
MTPADGWGFLFADDLIYKMLQCIVLATQVFASVQTLRLMTVNKNGK